MQEAAVCVEPDLGSHVCIGKTVSTQPGFSDMILIVPSGRSTQPDHTYIPWGMYGDVATAPLCTSFMQPQRRSVGPGQGDVQTVRSYKAVDHNLFRTTSMNLRTGDIFHKDRFQRFFFRI